MLITTKRIAAVCCCCLSLFLFACSSQPAEKENNIFLHAVDSSESVLHPKQVDFDMSVNDVLQALQLSEADIDKRLGEDEPRIIKSISIPGLSDEIMETFVFDHDKLITVEYAIRVSASDFETVCEALEKQASSAMPADLLWGENNISEGKGARWQDKKENMVLVSFPETDSESRVICLELHKGK